MEFRGGGWVVDFFGLEYGARGIDTINQSHFVSLNANLFIIIDDKMKKKKKLGKTWALCVA